MGGHRPLFCLIKADGVHCICREKIGLKCSSHDPLDILDPIMGPMGFVIHDIYQVNCHTEKTVASGQDETTHHLHIAGKGSCPTLSEMGDNTSHHLTGQKSVGNSRALFSVFVFADKVPETHSNPDFKSQPCPYKFTLKDLEFSWLKPPRYCSPSVTVAVSSHL